MTANLEKQNLTEPATTTVSVHFEGMVPQLRAEFERMSGATQIELLHPRPQLLYKRVQSVLRIVREILPAQTQVRIRITAEFADSIAALQPEQFSRLSPYDPQRGANIAMAKTIRAADDTFDIVINAALFINGADESDDDLTEKTATMAHVAAHEPQHVLMELDQTDSRYYIEAVPPDSAGRIYRNVIAEAVDEFRCELAAGRHTQSGSPREGTMADDLDKFRDSLNASHRLRRTDIPLAASIAFTAAKEFLKALAYLAAERIAEGNDADTPVLESKEWEQYGARIWPAAFDIFKSIPAADEPADRDRLVSALTQLSELVADWMLNQVGVLQNQ